MKSTWALGFIVGAVLGCGITLGVLVASNWSRIKHRKPVIKGR